MAVLIKIICLFSVVANAYWICWKDEDAGWRTANLLGILIAVGCLWRCA